MAKRGRRSVGDLSVVPIDFVARRPAPPADLNERAAAEWQAIVSALPDGWCTRETAPLLAQYCGHVAAAQRIAQQRDAITLEELRTETGLWRYDRLGRMAACETASLVSLATRLRLTQQSRYTPKAAGTATRNTSPGAKPWESA